MFLPDISKNAKSEEPPEEHLKANTVLSGMTVTACFTLAILLYAILGFRSNTHPLIYVVAGLLIAMGIWHIQTFVRNQKLKKQWKRRAHYLQDEMRNEGRELSATTAKLLDQPDLRNAVPASVTEKTTRHLVDKKT